jgi:hypothetical protein
MFVDNLKLDHFSIANEDRDAQFGIFLETFQLSAMGSVALALLLIASGRFPFLDWGNFTQIALKNYAYWKNRHEFYVSGLNIGN